MQSITSLACKIINLPINCIVSYILKDINTISLKPEDLDRLCQPDYIDTQKITINYYKLPYEEQRAYVDAYKQVVEMQGLVIADLEQQLKIANNIINGYKRLSVECPLKYGFVMKRQVHTYENVEFKTIEYGFIKRKIHNYVNTDVYNFGNAKVSYCGENFVFKYDDTFIDADETSTSCECEEPTQIQLCEVELPETKEEASDFLTARPIIKLTTDDDSSEDHIISDCNDSQSETEPEPKTRSRIRVDVHGSDNDDSIEGSISEPQAPSRLGDDVFGPADDNNNEYTISDCEISQSEPKPQEDEVEEKTDSSSSLFNWGDEPEVETSKSLPKNVEPVYVAGLEFKTPQEKEKIAKSKNTTVENLYPISKIPNVYTQHYMCYEWRMYELIRSQIQPMDEFERYVAKLVEGKMHYPSDLTTILTHMYIELSKRNDRLRCNKPRNITTVYYKDDVRNKRYKHYTTSFALTFDVNGHVNYYVKFEIETKDGKRHVASNNITNIYRFTAYRY